MEISGEHRYAETILEHLPVGIALLDTQDFRLLIANPVFHTFLDPQWRDGQALERPLSEWVPNAEKFGIMTILRTVAKTGIPYRADTFPFPGFERGVTYWNWTLEPLRDPDGHIRYLLLTTSEITQYIQAHQQAEAVQETLRREKGTLEEAQDSFLSLISHELRTPMTVIIGYIELLEMLVSQNNNLDVARVQQVFSRLNYQSDYLAHLIETLLDVAHIESGQVAILAMNCDLLPIVQQVIESMKVTAEQRQVNLTLEGIAPGACVMVHCDEHQMTRVFTNLISNALKYSPPGKNIEVGLRITPQMPQEVVCWVRDEGIGINQEELSHIFTRFYRSRDARSFTGGLGIGLYVVKEIVEGHRGRVWVESVPGTGSTFFIALPLLGN